MRQRKQGQSYVTDFERAYPHGQCVHCGAPLCARDRMVGWHCLTCLRQQTLNFGLHSKNGIATRKILH
jgi:hypothetical protein